MKNHLLLLVIFSILTSLVFTFIAKNSSRARIKYFFYLFCSFVLLSIVAGWLMYPFPF
jgi:uncharacterized integral membrane protein